MIYLTLSELAYLVKSVIHDTLDEDYWVTAEIAHTNCHYDSGHCYLDLVEKKNDITAAKMRATIWARNFAQISLNFKTVTGQNLQTGMKVLMLARLIYHEVYGLSLNILDIDPRYTLGEMLMKRREIIEHLTKDGIIDRNKQLRLPPVFQRIAVISSKTAAGYGDFLSRLNNNPNGYRFYYRLFSAFMQGEKAEQSIIKALEKCIKYREHFDAIVIIRGGGSAVDLNCFDSYPLAKMIALSPIPIFTGIGHERDESVADYVANMRLITPTAVAEFIITRSREFEASMDDLKNRLTIRTNALIGSEKHYLRKSVDNFSSFTRDYLKTEKSLLRKNIHELQTRALTALRIPTVRIKEYDGKLKNVNESLIRNNHYKLREFKKVMRLHTIYMLSMQSQKLENYEIKIYLLNPQNVLKKGYSITCLNGKIVKDSTSVTKDDIINTRLSSGYIISIVEGTVENNKNE